jgi:hypothetical protein
VVDLAAGLVLAILAGLIFAWLHPVTNPMLRACGRLVGVFLAVLAGLFAVLVLGRRRNPKTPVAPPVVRPDIKPVVDYIHRETNERVAEIETAAANDDRAEVRARLREAIARRKRAESEK